MGVTLIVFTAESRSRHVVVFRSAAKLDPQQHGRRMGYGYVVAISYHYPDTNFE